MMKIYLTQGAFALVDDHLYEYLNQFNWYIHRGYAKRFRKISDGPGPRKITMANMVLGKNPGPNMTSDHISRDKLDNRECNLRWLDKSEQMLNQNIRSDNTSGMVGISKVKSGKWQVKYKGQRLGTFADKDEAIARRQQAESEM